MSGAGEAVGDGGRIGLLQPDARSTAAMVASRAANLIPMPIERRFLCLGSATSNMASWRER